jgi:hypothetical protein
MPGSAQPIFPKDILPMKSATTAIAIFLLGVSLAGCAGMHSGGQNLNGFPLDEKCAEFWGSHPMYGGNLALAYGQNCTANDR